MNGPQTRRSPAATGLRAKQRAIGGRIDYAALAGSRPYVYADSGIGVRTTHLPRNWRERLPDAASYYAAQLDNLTRADAKGWAACRCPFHDDAHASASVNLTSGGFRCHACEARGDLVGFHMRRTGLGFKDAVRALIGGAR